MADVYVHIVETRTGTIVLNELPVAKIPDFSRSVNDDGSIKVEVPVGDQGVPSADRLRALVAEWRYSLAVSYGPATVGAPILAYGPIMTSSFDHASSTLTVGAGSIWALLARRLLVNPSGVVSSPLSMDEVMDVNYANLTLWGIARNLVSDSLSRGTGFDLPIDLPSSTVGTSVRNYPVYDLATVGQRLKDLTQVEQGPDVDWDPYFATSSTVRVTMRIGTPTLSQVGPDLLWDDGSSLAYINTDRNAQSMTSDVYVRGNATERAMQVAQAADRSLAAAGWPVLESVDGSHQSVVEFPTLQGYANEWVRYYKTPTETWECEVLTDASPVCGTYKPGDRATFNVQSHPWIPAGQYRQRILGWSSAGAGRLKLSLEALQGTL